MSEIQRKEYEEKKLKMRKAMGENLFDAIEEEDDDARTRRLKFLRVCTMHLGFFLFT
jgi:type II restriction/modification system DNA methylase subunit YeeA